jgi:hypothetical protein
MTHLEQKKSEKKVRKLLLFLFNVLKDVSENGKKEEDEEEKTTCKICFEVKIDAIIMPW